jgi:predicted TIM-barrel fold metal-dependent hydrolase
VRPDPITHFDAFCYLGRHMRLYHGQPESAEALLAAMDHFGIHEALAVDPLAAESNPMAGNQRIIERTRGHARLHPAWAGLMTQSRELPPPGELVAQMRELAVGTLFLFYRQFDIRLADWGLDDLLAELEAARVPVFLSAYSSREPGRIDATDWEGVVGVCRRFPDLPVVVTEGRVYKSQRAVYAALAACPNLRVDASALWLHRRIEFISREFGPQRLLWSSYLPMRNPGGALMQLDYSDLPEDELRLIAAGNLRQLLSWNPSIRFVGEEVQLPEPTETLQRAARERVDLSRERFHDCHGHIGRCSPHHVVEDMPSDLVREMDRFGIQTCCVFSLEGVMGDETYGNERVAEAVRQYPDRFVGFTLVNPNRGERALLEELARGREMGLRGVKLICDYQGYPSEGPLVEVACQFAHQHHLLILNHNWGSAGQIRRLCETYPNACFIAGHSTTAYGEVTRVVANLYICTCPCVDWGYAERLVGIYGADRLLFGSDLTDLPIGWGMGQILYANLSEPDKRKLLGANLETLLKRYSQ